MEREGVAEGQLLLANVGGGIDGGRGESARNEGVVEELFGVFGREEMVEIGRRSSGWCGAAGFGVEGDGLRVRCRDVDETVEDNRWPGDASGGGRSVVPAIFAGGGVDGFDGIAGED